MNRISTKKELRIFGLAFGTALTVIGTRLFFKHDNAMFLFITACGLTIFLSGIFAPEKLRPIQKVAAKLLHFITWLVSRAVLAFTFYFVITPMSLVIRLMGKDFLTLKIDKEKDSYWVKREGGAFDPTRCEKQY